MSVYLKNEVPLEQLSEFGFRYNDYLGLWMYNGFDEIVVTSWSRELRFGNVSELRNVEEVIFDLMVSGIFTKGKKD